MRAALERDPARRITIPAMLAHPFIRPAAAAGLRRTLVAAALTAAARLPRALSDPTAAAALAEAVLEAADAGLEFDAEFWLARRQPASAAMPPPPSPAAAALPPRPPPPAMQAATAIELLQQRAALRPPMPPPPSLKPPPPPPVAGGLHTDASRLLAGTAALRTAPHRSAPAAGEEHLVVGALQEGLARMCVAAEPTAVPDSTLAWENR